MVTVLPPLRFRPFLVCRTPELEMVRLLPNVTASSVAVAPLTLRLPPLTVELASSAEFARVVLAPRLKVPPLLSIVPAMVFPLDPFRLTFNLPTPRPLMLAPAWMLMVPNVLSVSVRVGPVLWL